MFIIKNFKDIKNITELQDVDDSNKKFLEKILEQYKNISIEIILSYNKINKSTIQIIKIKKENLNKEIETLKNILKENSIDNTEITLIYNKINEQRQMIRFNKMNMNEEFKKLKNILEKFTENTAEIEITLIYNGINDHIEQIIKNEEITTQQNILEKLSENMIEIISAMGKYKENIAENLKRTEDFKHLNIIDIIELINKILQKDKSLKNIITVTDMKILSIIKLMNNLLNNYKEMESLVKKIKNITEQSNEDIADTSKLFINFDEEYTKIVYDINLTCEIYERNIMNKNIQLKIYKKKEENIMIYSADNYYSLKRDETTLLKNFCLNIIDFYYKNLNSQFVPKDILSKDLNNYMIFIVNYVYNYIFKPESSSKDTYLDELNDINEKNKLRISQLTKKKGFNPELRNSIQRQNTGSLEQEKRTLISRPRTAEGSRRPVRRTNTTSLENTQQTQQGRGFNKNDNNDNDNDNNYNLYMKYKLKYLSLKKLI